MVGPFESEPVFRNGNGFFLAVDAETKLTKGHRTTSGVVFGKRPKAMKKALRSVALLASVISSHSQGIITFGGFSHDVKLANGTGPGQGYTAGLFLQSDLNTPIGVTDFIPGTGFLNPIDVSVPGHPVGDASAVYNFKLWWFSPTQKFTATSGPFTSGPLGGLNPQNVFVTPPDLGPNFFGIPWLVPGTVTVTDVPEPSTYALGILGLGALAMMCRRK